MCYRDCYVLLSPFHRRLVSNAGERTITRLSYLLYVSRDRRLYTRILWYPCDGATESLATPFRCATRQVIGKKRAALTQLEEECNLSITEEVVR